MDISRCFGDECGCKLRDSDCDIAKSVVIDGSIIESLVKAYNFSLKYTQDHPQLEIYSRDGKLYACDWDLPHEPGCEFELYEKRVASEIKLSE